MYLIAVSAVNIAIHQSLYFGMVRSENLCPHHMETKRGVVRELFCLCLEGVLFRGKMPFRCVLMFAALLRHTCTYLNSSCSPFL